MADENILGHQKEASGRPGAVMTRANAEAICEGNLGIDKASREGKGTQVRVRGALVEDAENSSSF